MKLVVIVATIMTASGLAVAQTNSTGTFTGVPNGALNSDPGTMTNSAPTTSGALDTQQQTDWKNSDRYAKGNHHNDRDFPPSTNGNLNPSGANSTAPTNTDLNSNH